MNLGVPVHMGGPAFNMPGGDFVPGMYLKKGYVITSRGCPNRCWFCSVPRREGGRLRELPITEGNIDVYKRQVLYTVSRFPVPDLQ